MQSHLPEFEAAGVSVYVVLYESVEQLRAFSDRQQITIPLLSDVGSKIISEIGILNTTLDESDEPFYGIPFPGSYVIGSNGSVVAKFFEQNSLIRAHPDVLLRAATGQVVAADARGVDAAHTRPAPASVEVDVSFDGDSLRAFLPRDLVVTLRVPTGQHLYGPPVSEGLVVTSVDVTTTKHLGAQAPQFPPTRPLVLAGTGETLHVFADDVEIRVPLISNGFPPEPDADGVSTIEVAGTIRWQSCDDEVCHIPRTEAFSITVRVEPPNLPSAFAGASPV